MLFFTGSNPNKALCGKDRCRSEVWHKDGRPSLWCKQHSCRLGPSMCMRDTRKIRVYCRQRPATPTVARWRGTPGKSFLGVVQTMPAVIALMTNEPVPRSPQQTPPTAVTTCNRWFARGKTAARNRFLGVSTVWYTNAESALEGGI
ncbi:hypothetical protein B0J13DRAFT_600932 [Dactylonectria estremocensis]|uniref:Uncharacterized protein n=1 Tax=Dactylonectria estremocensis TaxID=1079267 RepID=A0A9P9FI19_9HYPO|nr:hypothetical protein B0J13DRAFT_600932 [Dactylonectria estremocensis]